MSNRYSRSVVLSYCALVLVLSLVTSCEGSFRFFKSLWSSSSSRSSTTPSSLPLTEDPSPSASLSESYLQHYPQLNESYLAELVSANPNATNLEDIDRSKLPAELLNSFNQHNRPSDDSLEYEEVAESNVTLPPAFESNANISTYLANSGSTSNEDSNKPASESEEKPFEVLIQNDKTMAHLKFDQSGRDLVTCALYDIEKDMSVLKSVPQATGLQPPLTADYKTMLEAIRRCTELARRNLLAAGLLPSRKVSLNETSIAISNVSSTATNVLPPPPPSNISLAGSSFITSAASSLTNVTSSSNGGTTAPSNGIKNIRDSNFISVWKGIMPGTKWCGLGDSALNYNDLGAKADIDLCCRAHDHCPIRLKAFRMGYGLINFSFYTKSHCDCDEDFFKCLKQSPNNYASMLGNFYFNVLKVQCIKHEAPFVCIRKRTTGTRKEECIQYEVTNKTKMKIVPFEFHFR